MAEHQAIGNALAQEDTLLPDDGDETAELEVELANLLKADGAAPPVDTPAVSSSVGDNNSVAAVGEPTSKPSIGAGASKPVAGVTEPTGGHRGGVAVPT